MRNSFPNFHSPCFATIWVMAALLILAPLTAPADSARIDPRDPAIFTPEYFPDLADIPENRILLTGLKTLYPKRVVAERPAMADEAVARPPRLEEIRGKALFMRVYDLGKALPDIEENIDRNLVIDLRHVYADLPSTLALGRLLTFGDGFTLQAHGAYPYEEQGVSDLHVPSAGKREDRNPVIVLTNSRTRGPIEALLDTLQQRREIITIGLTTAGATGAYRKLLDDPPLHVISGDVRGASGRILLEEGFSPFIHTKISSQEDKEAYQALEDAAPIEGLLRRVTDRPRFDEARLVREFERRREIPQEEETPELPKEDYPHDAILFQALSIIEALEALGELAPFLPSS